MKGLLRANEEKEVIAVKRAYYAVQNVVSVFDDTLTRVADAGFTTKDASACLSGDGSLSVARDRLAFRSKS